MRIVETAPKKVQAATLEGAAYRESAYINRGSPLIRFISAIISSST